MLGIGLVNMLVALDQTVVSTALPSIVAELHGFRFYAWIASAYLLASVVTVPVFGRLGDYFGRKRFVIAAVIVFTVASVLCGLATDMRFLAAARALQGVGGGMMVGTAFASIPDLFPDPRTRVRWQVVMAAAYGIGTAAGPSLGGWLSEHFGWRSTFLVNLPVGGLALYFIWAHLPRYQPARTPEVRIDWTGVVWITLRDQIISPLLQGTLWCVMYLRCRMSSLHFHHSFQRGIASHFLRPALSLVGAHIRAFFAPHTFLARRIRSGAA